MFGGNQCLEFTFVSLYLFGEAVTLGHVLISELLGVLFEVFALRSQGRFVLFQGLEGSQRALYLVFA